MAISAIWDGFIRSTCYSGRYGDGKIQRTLVLGDLTSWPFFSETSANFWIKGGGWEI